MKLMLHSGALRRVETGLRASGVPLELYVVDREGAIRELRKAHDVFLRLGAEFELVRTRSHLRSLGVRLPPRRVHQGVGVLTGRELDIVRLVVRRKSNKEIAAALDISVRTVSTHVSNIFTKLSIESRGDLADLARDNPALAGQD